MPDAAVGVEVVYRGRDEVRQLVRDVVDSKFLPGALQGKPVDVLAAILMGAELGLSPMSAIQGIDVVDGKPTLSAETMRSLVYSADAGHRIDCTVYTSERVQLKGTRGDTGAEAVVEWTMADARQAKLDQKTNWKTYPRAMLLARASSELCRLLFPDVLKRIGSYTPEELQPDVQLELGEAEPVADVIDLAPAPPALVAHLERTAQNLEPDVVDVPLPDPADDVISEAARVGLLVELREAGLGDDDARHAFVHDLTDGRTVHVAELTHLELSRARARIVQHRRDAADRAPKTQPAPAAADDAQLVDTDDRPPIGATPEQVRAWWLERAAPVRGAQVLMHYVQQQMLDPARWRAIGELGQLSDPDAVDMVRTWLDGERAKAAR